MEPVTRTLDLEEERDLLTQQIEEIDERLDGLARQALDIEPPQDDEERERYQQLQADFDALETERTHTRGYLEALTRALDGDPNDPQDEGWQGSEIVMTELSGYETRLVKDEVQRKAEQLGSSQYQEGYHEVAALQRIVERTPEGCPDPEDIQLLPDRLFSWLWTRANALNTVGDFDMGNSSLRERMREVGQSQQEPAPVANTDGGTPAGADRG